MDDWPLISTIILLLAAMAAPAVAGAVFYIFWLRADRTWKNSNKSRFPRGDLIVAFSALAAALAYLLLGAKPLEEWISARLIATNLAVPLNIRGAEALSPTTTIWAEAVPTDHGVIDDRSSIDVVAWLVRKSVHGKCGAPREAYRLTLGGSGFDRPTAVGQDGVGPQNVCSLGWAWSPTPLHAGTYTLQIGFKGPVDGHDRSTYIPLRVDVQHVQSLSEKLQWLQGFGLIVLSSASTAVVKPWMDGIIERRKQRKDSGILRP